MGQLLSVVASTLSVRRNCCVVQRLLLIISTTRNWTVFADAPPRTIPEEEEEFREVLYTTLAREVEEWVQSLESRGITLPVAVREEALLIIGEQRFGS